MSAYVWVFAPDGREDHFDAAAVFRRKVDAEDWAGSYIRRHNFDRRTNADYESEKVMRDLSVSNREIYRRYNSAWYVSGSVTRRKVR